MILALTDATIGMIVVACVAAFSAITVAVVQAVALNRKVEAAASAADVAAKAIGTPNGHGNVVQMQERLLLDFAEHATQNAREHAEVRGHVEDMRTHVEALASKLERHLSDHRAAPTDVGA